MRITSLLGASLLAITIASPGYAQQVANEPSATDATPDEGQGSSDEIVVTAQKREERAKDIPISIAAFGESALQKAGIDDILKVEKLVPNFSVQKGAQTTNIRINIRGIGASGNTGIDPSVATFLNGAYIARPGAILGKMYDVSAIEVLRGPQGTLFGRNATVGAFVIRTNAPSPDFEGKVEASYARFNEREVQGFINIPLGDKAGLRIAGIAGGFDGYARTYFREHKFGDQNNYGGRLTFALEPTDSLKWIVRADYMKVTGDGATQVEVLPATLTPTGLANLTARTGGRLPDLVDPFDRRSYQSVFGDLNDRQWGVISDLAWESGSGITLKLIDSYRDWKNDQTDGDFLFLPLDGLSRLGTYRSKAQNHELQFISPSREWLNGKFDMVAGLYYFDEKYAITENFSFLPDFCGLIPNPTVRANCIADPQSDATVNRFDQKATSYAIYGQGTYRFTDTLGLTLGGRWTSDKKTGSFVQTLGNRAGSLLRAPEDADLRTKKSKFTWRAALDWKPRPDALIYASYSTGYKSGGFNSGGGTTPLLNRRIFAPETVSNYEVGAKVDWLDKSLTTNVAVFRMDISDFQDRTFDGTSFVVTNAGKLRQQGVEFELVMKPTRGLRFNAAIAYLDSNFLSYPFASGLPGFGGTQDLTGKRSNFSPNWQGSLGAEYDGDLGDSGMTWTLRTDYRFYGDQNVGSTTDANPQTVQDGYGLLSAGLTINGVDDRWSVGIFGENLTGANYCTSIAGQPLGGPLGVLDPVNGGTMQRCLVGAPRTYGVRASFSF